ncbi:hypothetical protein [Streptomyces sp. G-G2]|uniref:hypothetical protein n=1 Tax=Streptomyces sp. G-G2 TaxID=3046201 RepID=UPI0024BB22BD|nr:hypothetical protein [Streptomyces sp. G-G2]MDJ0383052.1 hypothetical protein [Streptomyces sp. G-G2]
MNDSPGWATPGPSPSDGERTGAPEANGTGAQPPSAQPSPQNPAQPPVAPAQPAAQAPAQPAPQDPRTAPAQPPADPKWSAQQPPPGQWSSPGAQDAPGAPGAPADGSAQPPRPGAGWGSYDGAPGGQYGGPQYGNQRYGNQYGGPGAPGGWGKPPAAKPGVIPLRPLGLGEILDGAVTTMRTHWRSVLSVTAVVAVIVQIATVIFQRYSLDRLMTDPSSITGPGEMLDIMGGSLAVSVITAFIQVIGGILVTAMLTMIFSRAVLGHPSTVAGAWRDARPQLLRLGGLSLLLTAGAIVLILVLMLPGLLADSIGLAVVGALAGLAVLVWLWIRFSLASSALMLEKATVFKALGRSAKLTQGAWWRIFGITLLTALIVGIVSMIVAVPFTALAIIFGGGLDTLTAGNTPDSWTYLILAGIGGVITTAITMPMQSGVTVLLYIDQRIRREALDLELARAAGVDDYGTPGAAPQYPGAGG